MQEFLNLTWIHKKPGATQLNETRWTFIKPNIRMLCLWWWSGLCNVSDRYTFQLLDTSPVYISCWNVKCVCLRVGDPFCVSNRSSLRFVVHIDYFFPYFLLMAFKWAAILQFFLSFFFFFLPSSLRNHWRSLISRPKNKYVIKEDAHKITWARQAWRCFWSI